MILIVDAAPTPNHSIVTSTDDTTGITRTLQVAARVADVVAWIESDPNSGLVAPAPELEALLLS